MMRLPKKEWGPGPWQDEPDRLEWRYKGFPCLMVRNSNVTGSWCGYVGVAPGHPWHGKGYSFCTRKSICKKQKTSGWCDHTPDHLIRVHGGLTYANECHGHICHVPKAGEPDHVFWFGFDCSHCDDLAPKLSATCKSVGAGSDFLDHGHYWTVAEVKAETERLARQLAKVKK